MTNREYAIKKINEVLKEADNTELADIFIEVIKFPRVCRWCMSKTCASCNEYITKWLQSEDTSRQYSNSKTR